MTVHPVPDVTSTALAATTCSGVAFAVTPVNGTDGSIPAGTKYSWPAPTVTGGMTGAGIGNLASNVNGTLTNLTNEAQTATYTVTPTYSGCPGTTFPVVVTVNPKPAITNMTHIVCSGAAFAVAPQNGVNGVVPVGTTYSWFIPTVTGGMTGGVSGTDQPNIHATLVNNTTSNQTATYTVTPKYLGCTGTPYTVVVTVKPKPVINNFAQELCSGNIFGVSPVQGVDGIVPASTLYSWPVPVMNNGFTGGTSGAASPHIFGTLYNPTLTPGATAVYTITPTSNGCDGDPFTVTVTVNSTPVISNKTVAICGAETFTIMPQHLVAQDTVPAGTTYSWPAPTTPTGVTGYASGTNATSVSGTLMNTTGDVKTVVYDVTATTPAPESCSRAFTVTVTLNPKPVIAAKTATICGDGTFTVTPVDGTGGDIVPAGTTYTWAAPNTPITITGYASGTDQSSINGTLVNTTSTAQTVVYNVTATTPAPASCTNTFTVTVTVNPKPVIAAKTATICSGGTFTVTMVDGTGGDLVPTGTTYTWSAPTTPVELTGYAAGLNANNVSGTLTNTTNVVQTVVYNVTATTPAPASCTNTFTVTVIVNPKASIASKTSTICSAGTFSITPVNGSGDILPSGTTYSWAPPTLPVEITGYEAGIDQTSISGTLVNTSSVPQTVIYNVTAKTPDNCTSTFTVTVTVTAKPYAGEDQTVCAGASATLTGTITADGSWTEQTGNPVGVTLGTTSSGVATASFVSTLTTGTVFYFVYTANACTDTMKVTITGKPDAGADQTGLCGGGSATLTGISPTTGTWTAEAGNPAGATLGATASGVATVDFANSAEGTFLFIYSAGGCSDTMMISANPTPAAISLSATPATCTGATEGSNGEIVLSTAANGTHFGVSTRNAIVYDGPASVIVATAIVGFPATIKNDVPNSGGSYIVRIFHTDGCFRDEMVSVSANACCVPPTANFIPIPASCTGMAFNNNGRIVMTSHVNGDRYGISTVGAVAYDGPDYASSTAIPSLPADLVSGIPNVGGGAYWVRVYNGAGCSRDYPLTVPSSNCMLDPMGYIYCEETGEIITGGTISVSGPGGFTITENGINGRYQFYTDGTSGIYTISYTPPPGAVYTPSTARLPAGVLDPTGLMPNPYYVGSTSTNGTVLNNFSAAANPFYLQIDMAPGDPEVLTNNIPMKGCALGLGNTVFMDLDNNGYDDGMDVGIPGVALRLYRVVGNKDGDGNSEADDILIDTGSDGDPTTPTDGNRHTTDLDGLYLFQGLTSGRYYVKVETDQFATGAALHNSNSATLLVPTSASDNDTNADNNALQPGGPGTVVTTPAMSLAIGAQPTGPEKMLLDANDDLTSDLGFRCTVIAEAGNPMTICATKPLILSTLEASIAPAGLGGVWNTSGDGSFIGGTAFGTATGYQPGANDRTAGTVTLTLTTNDPAGACGTVSDSVIITILRVDCGAFPWNGN